MVFKNKNKNKNIYIWKLAVAYPQGGSSSILSRSNWNLGILVFEEGENGVPGEKTSQRKYENQQQTQPTSDTECGNRSQATLAGGECSHHCAIPAPWFLRFSDLLRSSFCH